MVPALLAQLFALLHAPAHTTTATRYADTHRDEGGTPACWRRCLRRVGHGCVGRFPDRDFDATYPTRVAHRHLPCGTLLLVQDPETGATAVASVLDRGPWGRAPATRARRDHRPPASGPPRPRSARAGTRPRPAYRGDLDLSPSVADALGLSLHRGRMRVLWWVIGLP